MKLSLHRFDLPLRHVFTISRGSSSVYRTLIVELEQDGVSGYGEAGENDFYGASFENMSAALEAVRPVLESSSLDDPAELWRQLEPQLAGSTFAQCALDLAAHDLWGKLRGQAVWKLWGLSLDDVPVTDYTIGIDSIDVMVEKMREFAGWPVYKIKLGTPDDIAIVRALREHTKAVFRVDANCGWGVEETIRNSFDLEKLGVEFIEQPLPPDRWDGMKEVWAKSALPLVADESCQQEPDVDACGGHFHGVNVKLVKCGGLTPARRMLARARQLGLKTMVGCMTETSVGISAIAQLLPMLDYVDMDGALLLADDVADGVTIDRGQVRFPAKNGCGITLRKR
ncbi:MAG: dipeptide epimerase [Planctomycetota bacterium]|jgi:L-alanine-DL-glutamate epimerase-like enolase superfamily enzyme